MLNAKPRKVCKLHVAWHPHDPYSPSARSTEQSGLGFSLTIKQKALARESSSTKWAANAFVGTAAAAGGARPGEAARAPTACSASTLWGRTSVPKDTPELNQLLADLPTDLLAHWKQHLEAVKLDLGAVLCESGETPKYVYFPTEAIASLLYVMEDGDSAEIEVAGNEGVVGISVLLGGDYTPSRAVVQSAGRGFRISESVLKEEFKDAAVLRLMLRYIQVLILGWLKRLFAIVTIPLINNYADGSW